MEVRREDAVKPESPRSCYACLLIIDASAVFIDACILMLCLYIRRVVHLLFELWCGSTLTTGSTMLKTKTQNSQNSKQLRRLSGKNGPSKLDVAVMVDVLLCLRKLTNRNKIILGWNHRINFEGLSLYNADPVKDFIN